MPVAGGDDERDGVLAIARDRARAGGVQLEVVALAAQRDDGLVDGDAAAADGTLHDPAGDVGCGVDVLDPIAAGVRHPPVVGRHVEVPAQRRVAREHVEGYHTAMLCGQADR
ncbi:MAG: hypothetical protein WKF83_11040 [Nocardioidaceae bacterium]